MLVTTVYLYNQNVNLKIKADTDKESWGYEMYNHPIKVYKGIDNTIQLSLKNDNQKSLTITDKTITFNILDNVGDTGVLLSKTASVVNGIKGTAKVIITEADLLNLDSQYLNYSVKVVDGEANTSIGYVDGAYDVLGQFHISDGVFPTLKDSQVLNTADFTISGSTHTSNPLVAHSKLNQNTALQTAAFYFAGTYTGTIVIQGTLNDNITLADDDYFDIKTLNLTNKSGVSYTNWNGVHNRIRFKCTPTVGAHASMDTFSAADGSRAAGTYTGVTGTSSGSGTVGTFNIVVNGSGAVTSVTIVTSGSGHAVDDTITIADSSLGSGGAAAFTMDVATLSGGLEKGLYRP